MARFMQIKPMRTSNLRYFTQTAILQQIGPRRLAKLLNPFDADLKAGNLVLPHLNGENDHYFSELAATLACTLSLPESLRDALLSIEATTSPENERLLYAALRRRAPGVSRGHGTLLLTGRAHELEQRLHRPRHWPAAPLLIPPSIARQYRPAPI